LKCSKKIKRPKQTTCHCIGSPIRGRPIKGSSGSGSAPYGKFKPARTTIENVSKNYNRECFMKLPKNELKVHSNTPWAFLKMWDQMKTASFCHLSHIGNTNKNYPYISER
jgi:hypothetical protein